MAVRLFVGNMPYGATEADLRAHFSASARRPRSSFPVDRETGRPADSPSSNSSTAPIAEEAIERFNQQPFMGRSLSVSEARPREAGGAGGGFRPAGGPAAASAVRGPAAAVGGPPGRRRLRRSAARRRLRRLPARRPPRPASAPACRQELRSAEEEERLEREALGEQGARPEGPDQGALHRPPRRALRRPERRQHATLTDFDDPRDSSRGRATTSRTPAGAMATHVKVIAALFLVFGAHARVRWRCSRRCCSGVARRRRRRDRTTKMRPSARRSSGLTGIATDALHWCARGPLPRLRDGAAQAASRWARIARHRPRGDRAHRNSRSAPRSASTRWSFCSRKTLRRCFTRR